MNMRTTILFAIFIAFSSLTNSISSAILPISVEQKTYNLSEPRIHASAVPLDDHRILVVGGKGSENLSNVMDVYDVTTDSWTTNRLPEPRAQQGGPTAGLLESVGLVFYGGGLGNGVTTDGTVDLIDTKTLEVVASPKLSFARDILSCAGRGDTFICAGGQNKSQGESVSFVTDVFTVDPHNQSEITVDSSYKLSVGRKKLSGGSAGDIIAFGMGYSDVEQTKGYSDAVDIYNISSHTWRAAKLPSKEPRMYGTAVGCGGYIIFAGGQIGGGRSLAVDALNGATGEWVVDPGNLTVARSLVSSACLVDRYAVFAGGQIPTSDVVDVVDTVDWTWSTLPQLNTPRSALAGAGIQNCVLFAGGIGQEGNDTDIYCLPKRGNIVGLAATSQNTTH